MTWQPSGPSSFNYRVRVERRSWGRSTVTGAGEGTEDGRVRVGRKPSDTTSSPLLGHTIRVCTATTREHFPSPFFSLCFRRLNGFVISQLRFPFLLCFANSFVSSLRSECSLHQLCSPLDLIPFQAVICSDLAFWCDFECEFGRGKEEEYSNFCVIERCGGSEAVSAIRGPRTSVCPRRIWIMSSNPILQAHGKDVVKPSWILSLPHVIVATISSLLFGYHLGVVNDTLEAIAIDLGFSGDTMSEGLVVSTCLAGAFVGSIFSGSIADGFGRKRAFQMTAIPMIIGASISAISKSLGGMLIGRFCVGIGMGIGPPAAAMYVAEVSPAYVRGTFGSFTQIATCFGLMASFFIGIPAKETKGWWRICFWVPVIPAALLAICIELCAESPHWLFKNGRGTEAEAQLEKLLGPLYVKAAIAELSKVEKGDETSEDVSVLELFRGRHARVVFIGGTLFALQQLSGINAVFYFSSVVFKKAGVPANTANICVGVVNLAGSLAASVLMDKLGRRVLLIGSFFGMAMSMVLEVNATSSFVSSTGAVYLSVGGILMFVLSFALGTGPVPSLLLSEILPNRIRAKAMAFCMAVHWVVNFFVGLLFLRLLEQLGPEILYSSFACFCLIAVVFVKKNVMETKGKTLQEIEMALLPSAQ